MFSVPTASAHAQMSGPPDPVMTRLMHHERAAHVGETLPSGIELVDRTGKPVDLRSVLHGKTILLKIRAGCPPCEMLLNAVRESGGHGRGKDEVPIVVLRVGDEGHASMDLPATVMALYNSDKMRGDGFLDGELEPTAFYLNADLKLVRRRPGLPVDPNDLLYFPAQAVP